MKKSKYHLLKIKAIELRKKGRSYGEIQRMMKANIPKSTLSNWCNSIYLVPEQKIKLQKNAEKNIHKGRLVALAINKKKRIEYLREVDKRISHLALKMKNNKDIQKIALAMLYLGEGSKTQRGSLMFGNSSEDVIRLFMYLLRSCYIIDEKKFRCTVQCRADQDIKKLEIFWSESTGISLTQFYKARVDVRSIGKKSKKLNYKGVCRIDYFSADIFIEIMKIIESVTKKGM